MFGSYCQQRQGLGIPLATVLVTALPQPQPKAFLLTIRATVSVPVCQHIVLDIFVQDRLAFKKHAISAGERPQFANMSFHHIYQHPKHLVLTGAKSISVPAKPIHKIHFCSSAFAYAKLTGSYKQSTLTSYASLYYHVYSLSSTIY